MTISVWRYSHLALALSSFLLLTLAAVTGVILSFEPIDAKLQPYRSAHFKSLTLAQALPALKKAHPGVNQLTVDAHGFVQVKGSDAKGEELLAYVDPENGKILGVPVKQSEFFQWVTAVHRSLFIHETGRFLIGLTAFLLMLITVSGVFLIVQRQRGFKRFFTRIARDSFAQYYHVVLGRLSLLPIFIIALSGTYLSLVRFELINIKTESPKVDFDNLHTQPVKQVVDFGVFKEVELSDVESVEFPFSEDVEDYYTLKLKDREVAVNQLTGEVLAEVKYPTAVFWTNLSLDLHTGRGSSLWAIVLALASGNILFFIYSGFAITIRRRSNRTKNKYKAGEAKFVILVGSENGSTFGFAKAIHAQLLKAGERSFLTEMNNYQSFEAAEHLIVVTATYGLGEAPTNASRFAAGLEKHAQNHAIRYSVLGFGSHAYPDFCKYAYEVGHLLAQQPWATALTDIHTVNDRSPDEFSLWAESWSQQSGVQVTVLPELYSNAAKRLDTLTIASNLPEKAQPGDTFTVVFKRKRLLRVTSGDLLAIYPENDHRERLYSIGLINNEIQLTVKLHEGGLGSGYLANLNAGQKMKARIINNQHFHFPEKAKSVLMVCNGTGIAPFLGMISQNEKHIPCDLYCGFRERKAYEKYEGFLVGSSLEGKVNQLHVATSREGDKHYVIDLLKRDTDLVTQLFLNQGVLMICGSLAMQKDVLDLLETFCETKTGERVSYYQSRGQILTDCY
ncbi:MAG: PepSY domain-containing protein [Bacteroidota bacterium]